MSTLYRRITLQLPDHWTPEQALAVYDLLSDLVDAIWNRYEIPLKYRADLDDSTPF